MYDQTIYILFESSIFIISSWEVPKPQFAMSYKNSHSNPDIQLAE